MDVASSYPATIEHAVKCVLEKDPKPIPFIVESLRILGKYDLILDICGNAIADDGLIPPSLTYDYAKSVDELLQKDPEMIEDFARKNLGIHPNVTYWQDLLVRSLIAEGKEEAVHEMELKNKLELMKDPIDNTARINYAVGLFTCGNYKDGFRVLQQLGEINNYYALRGIDPWNPNELTQIIASIVEGKIVPETYEALKNFIKENGKEGDDFFTILQLGLSLELEKEKATERENVFQNKIENMEKTLKEKYGETFINILQTECERINIGTGTGPIEDLSMLEEIYNNKFGPKDSWDEFVNKVAGYILLRHLGDKFVNAITDYTAKRTEKKSQFLSDLLAAL